MTRVDCISRADAIQAMQDKAKKLKNRDTINGLCGAVAILFDLPSVTPQEPQIFKWCDTCKEYDQENHCCHRWSKAIRDTVEEMKQEQEPRWIPVSERLPKWGEEVLTIDNDGNYEINHIIDDDINEWFYDGVVAWMPLPEPYKAESEGEDGQNTIKD